MKKFVQMDFTIFTQSELKKNQKKRNGGSFNRTNKKTFANNV